MNLIVVTAFRAGQRDNHCYVVGVFDGVAKAKMEAKKEADYRGGKYGCEGFECALGSSKEGRQVFYIPCCYEGSWGTGCDYVSPNASPHSERDALRPDRKSGCDRVQGFVGINVKKGIKYDFRMHKRTKSIRKGMPRIVRISCVSRLRGTSCPKREQAFGLHEMDVPDVLGLSDGNAKSGVRSRSSKCRKTPTKDMEGTPQRQSST